MNTAYAALLISDQGPYGNFYESSLYFEIKRKINFIGPSEKSFADYLSEVYQSDDQLSRYDMLESSEKLILNNLIVRFDSLSKQRQFEIKCNCASHENGSIQELRQIIRLISQEN